MKWKDIPHIIDVVTKTMKILPSCSLIQSDGQVAKYIKNLSNVRHESAIKFAFQNKLVFPFL